MFDLRSARSKMKMSVWKRLSRVGKLASKFQYTIHVHDLWLSVQEGAWTPQKLCLSVSRRSRKYHTKPKDWVPSMQNPFDGSAIFAKAEEIKFTSTLYRESRSKSFEDKFWQFTIEDVDSMGKRRAIATLSVNIAEFLDFENTQQHVPLEFKSSSLGGKTKILRGSANLHIECCLLKEGQATDADMQSLASIMSSQNDSDIANMIDLDDELENSSNNNSNTLSRIETKEKIAALAEEFGFLAKDSETFDDGVKKKTPAAKPSFGLSGTRSRTVSDSIELGASKDSFEGIFLTPADCSPQASSNTQAFIDPTQPLSQSECLLRWCQKVTRNYRNVKISNFTSSWRNGLAFCAVIHSFRPDLINFNSMQSNNIKENCVSAFDAAAKIGVPRLLDVQDMVHSSLPDKLAVMTYVHQLRLHLDKSSCSTTTNNNNNNEQNSNESENSLNMRPSNFLQRNNVYSASTREKGQLSPVKEQSFSEIVKKMKSKKQRDIDNSRDSLSKSLRRKNSIERLASETSMRRGSDSFDHNSDSSENDAMGRVAFRSKPSKSLSTNALSANASASSMGDRDDDLRRRAREMINAFKRKQISPRAKKDLAQDVSRAVEQTLSNGSPTKHVLPSDSVRSSPLNRMRTINASVRFRKALPEIDEDVGGGFQRGLSRRRTTAGFQRASDGLNRVRRTMVASDRAVRKVDRRLNEEEKSFDEVISDLKMEVKGLEKQLSLSKNELVKVESDVKQGDERREHNDSSDRPSTAPSRAEFSNNLPRSVVEGKEDSEEKMVNSSDNAREQNLPQASITTRNSQTLTESTDVFIFDDSSLTSMHRRISCSSNEGKDEVIEQTNVIQMLEDERPIVINNFDKENESFSSPDKIINEEDAAPLSPLSDKKSLVYQLEKLEEEKALLDEHAKFVELQIRSCIPSFAANEAESTSNSTNSPESVDFSSIEASSTSSKKRASPQKSQIGNSNEDELMQTWFALVTRKNELIRQEMKLNILIRDQDLLEKYNRLNKELQHIMSKAESEKTAAQRKREKMLLEELMDIVKERDELVQQLDAHEQGDEEDAEIGKSALAKVASTSVLLDRPHDTNSLNRTKGSVASFLRSWF